MTNAAWPLAASLLLLAACATPEAVPVPDVVAIEPAPEGWRAVALPEDGERIDGIERAWEQALSQARSRGFAGLLRREGALLDPAAALPRAAPPPGPYWCRLIRFGAGRRAVVAYQRYFCHVVVEGEQLSLTKEDGSERPGGYLWADGDNRMVFIGAVALGSEPLPPPYGANDRRNLVGVVERVGPFHYRLVMPWPPSEATLDLLELVPFVVDEEY
jgi:hypothetical protein